MICFPAPLNICLPLSYGSSVGQNRNGIEDETLQALRDGAGPAAISVPSMKLFGEDWD